MGVKKNVILGKAYLPEELHPVLDFLSSMKYTLQEIKNLSPLEVEFIRTRCKEEHIKYLDEAIERIAGVYYDEKGNKKTIDNFESAANFQRKRVIFQYDGKVFPSKNALARYIKKSPSYINARLKEFKIIGFTDKKIKKGEKDKYGNNRPNERN